MIFRTEPQRHFMTHDTNKCMLTRRSLLNTLFVSPLLAQTRKPNFVILFADDMGYGDVKCFGSPDVPTPNIDSIAANGIQFTDGYSSCAVCSPSRAALLTGRYQHRFGHEFNPGEAAREAEVNFGLPHSEKVLPQYLKPAGYRSAVIGKWHLGIREGYHPLDRGFDEYFGFLGGANDYGTTETPGAREVPAAGKKKAIPAKRQGQIFRNREKVDEPRYLTEAFADEAAKFIDRNRNNPFLLYLPFNAIHGPFQATDKYLKRFSGIQNVRHRWVAAMTSALDDAVGQVLSKLRETGLEQNTVIFFLSDNGSPLISGGGSNGPLSGEKCSYFDGGIRVPFLGQWKGRWPAGKKVSHPVVSRDILPTFLAAAGISLPKDREYDGVDLTPFVTGRSTAAPHDALYWRAGTGHAVRMGKWKLVEYGGNRTRLYDLSADIGEKKDLSASKPEVVKELRQMWESWSNKMAKPRWPARYRELTINGETVTWEL